MSRQSLYDVLPAPRQSDEIIDILLAKPGVRIERIVSTGQTSPPGFWYDQHEAEWVAVLRGAAQLRFADEEEDRPLAPGDWVYIAPRRKHRVAWTDPAQATVWLAVFFPESAPHPQDGPP